MVSNPAGNADDHPIKCQSTRVGGTGRRPGDFILGGCQIKCAELFAASSILNWTEGNELVKAFQKKAETPIRL